jgi:two-component system sensor histidine kinase QseC
VTNLNRLFWRVQDLIEQERHSTADAAHELRTPLAGIRARAQAARKATDHAERTRALDGVMAGCDHATHAVEQMLTLARLAPDAVSLQPTMEVRASDVRVMVRDAGPDIPAEQRANVGRRFYRAPGTQAPGSGLGLSIVQRILDLHRGTMRLDSPATTIGLQVTIALPRVVG